MRRLTLVLLITLAASGAAEAITLRDIIELSKAGLSDDVLVTLVEMDRSVFPIDRDTIKTLKQEGVSERVMIAMIRSGRETPPEPAPAPPVEAAIETPAPTPQVVIVDHHEPQRVQQVLVPVPVYVPVGHGGRSRHRYDERVTPASPYYTGQVRPAVPVKTPEPVYWGHGGKLRPDAWGQPRKK